MDLATGRQNQARRAGAPGAATALARRDPDWVNPRDPALALGPDGKPARSRRAPLWEDVPDEKWDDWRWQLSNRVNTLEEVGQVLNLTEEERAGLTADDKFRVDITPYFASLIDPDDPDDPIRRQVIPLGREQQAFTAMMADSLAEDRHSPVPGLVHRYPDRVLMLITTQCASYCRYCTRSRIVGDPTQNFNRRDHEAQLEYLRRTPQVRDVLISGGDGLTLAPKLLESVMRGLRDIPHIEIIRIGTRVPVFLPQRVDDELCDMLAKYHPLWMNLHFNHPNEITPEVSRAVDKLSRAGIPIGNQSVLLAGVNDCVHIQRALVHRLVENRIRPYYLYQCDLVEGSGHFRTPVGKGLEIMEGLRGHTSRLRGPDVRHRRARRRRQDPGHAELPDQLLRPQGRAPELRGLHHDLRGARALPEARPGGVRVLPARAPRARPVRRPRPARGRADVDRAEGLRGRPHARQHRGASPPGPVEVGARSASGRSRASPGDRCRSSSRARTVPGADEAGTNGATPPGKYAPGEEPRPKEGEPTGSAHGELL